MTAACLGLDTPPEPLAEFIRTQSEGAPCRRGGARRAGLGWTARRRTGRMGRSSAGSSHGPRRASPSRSSSAWQRWRPRRSVLSAAAVDRAPVRLAAPRRDRRRRRHGDQRRAARCRRPATDRRRRRRVRLSPCADPSVRARAAPPARTGDGWPGEQSMPSTIANPTSTASGASSRCARRDAGALDRAAELLAESRATQQRTRRVLLRRAGARARPGDRAGIDAPCRGASAHGRVAARRARQVSPSSTASRSSTRYRRPSGARATASRCWLTWPSRRWPSATRPSPPTAASAMELARGSDVDDAALARAEALSARVAIERGQIDAASTLAASAIERAIASDRADIECDALGCARPSRRRVLGAEGAARTVSGCGGGGRPHSPAAACRVRRGHHRRGARRR